MQAQTAPSAASPEVRRQRLLEGLDRLREVYAAHRPEAPASTSADVTTLKVDGPSEGQTISCMLTKEKLEFTLPGTENSRVSRKQHIWYIVPGPCFHAKLFWEEAPRVVKIWKTPRRESDPPAITIEAPEPSNIDAGVKFWKDFVAQINQFYRRAST